MSRRIHPTAILLGLAACAMLARTAIGEGEPPAADRAHASSPEEEKPRSPAGTESSHVSPRTDEADASQAAEGEAPSDTQIDRWLAKLDSDRYLERERATRKLIEFGEFALDRLAAAADSEKLEVSSRSIEVLQQLAQRADGELQLEALRRLTNLENRPDVRRQAREQIAAVWERISLPRVLEAGGRLEQDLGGIFINQRGERSQKLIIGPEWTSGDEGLEDVARLGFVTTVSVRRAPVTMQGLGHLTSMESLRVLELYGLGLQEEELAKLQKQLPNVRLDVRRGAMLGVRGSLQTPNAEIRGVEPDSAAERAGLQLGDVITKVDDAEVRSFADLTSEIAKHEPGSTATLEVRRNGRVLKRDVTFDGWE